MDVEKAIAELREERQRLDDAILAVERLADGPRKRGRPRKSIQDYQDGQGGRSGKPAKSGGQAAG